MAKFPKAPKAECHNPSSIIHHCPSLHLAANHSQTCMRISCDITGSKSCSSLISKLRISHPHLEEWGVENPKAWRIMTKGGQPPKSQAGPTEPGHPIFLGPASAVAAHVLQHPWHWWHTWEQFDSLRSKMTRRIKKRQLLHSSFTAP